MRHSYRGRRRAPPKHNTAGGGGVRACVAARLSLPLTPLSPPSPLITPLTGRPAGGPVLAGGPAGRGPGGGASHFAGRDGGARGASENWPSRRPPSLLADRPPTSSHPSPPSHAHAHTDPLPALWPQEGALLPPGRHRLPGPPGGPAAGGERERGEMRGAGGGHFPPPKTSAPFPSFHPSHRSSLSSLFPPFSSHSAWATTTPCARRPT